MRRATQVHVEALTAFLGEHEVVVIEPCSRPDPLFEIRGDSWIDHYLAEQGVELEKTEAVVLASSGHARGAGLEPVSIDKLVQVCDLRRVQRVSDDDVSVEV